MISGLGIYECPATIIENRTDTWVEYDQNSMLRAKKRCVVHYPDAPCLKTFIKKEELNYYAICGVEND